MPVPPDRAWQLPWLRLHLFMRDVIAVPWGEDWPIVKRELALVRGASARDDAGRVVQLAGASLCLTSPDRRPAVPTWTAAASC